MKIVIEITKEEYKKAVKLANHLESYGYDSLQRRIRDGKIIDEKENKEDEDI